MSAARALLAGGARHLVATLTGGLLLVWVAQVANEARLVAPDPTPVVLDRHGAFITQAGHQESGRVEYGYWVVPSPPLVVAATLALEDQRFWHHPGVDVLALARAAWQHLTGHGHASGASTIAMQVARMQHPRPRTLWSKAVEAGVGLMLTARYGHAAVLAQYLRLAPYGQGSHGIGHAAWWYFGRPAADLDLAQAALLAAIPQSPARLGLRSGNPHTIARARLALDRLRQSEQVLSGDLGELATTQPAALWRRPACTALVLRLQARARLLPARDVPVLHATVDLALQAGLARQLAAELQDWQGLGAQQAALMVVQRISGEVLAAIAGVPHAPGAGLDFVSTLRSPGSAEKPFFYARALDDATLRPGELLLDAPGQAPGIANADHGFLGPMTPGQALANSRNVPAAALLRRMGLDAGFSALCRFGLADADAPPPGRFGLGLAIGALPTTLERLTRAYAVLADGGTYRGLRWLDDEPETAPRQVISAGTAALVTHFLSDPMARLPSFPRYGSSEYPLPVALKTGTSQGYRDAWTVAWSRDFLVSAWVGRPDAAPMAQVSGGRAAARLVQSVLLALHHLGRSDLVASDLDVPGGAMLPCAGKCSVPGQSAVPDTRIGQAPEAALRMRIVQPANNMHFWRNPDLPAALDRLVMRVSGTPEIRQVTWLVDGAPIATVAADVTASWPMSPGRHRIEVRLPLATAISSSVNIDVE